MRRLGAALAALVLVIGALWYGPRLADWERYRDRLADIAATRLGRPVTLAGPVTLILLPQPRIEAGDVTLGPAQDGLNITARALRLRLDLGALLRGRLEPRELVLVGGDVRLPWPPAELPSFRPPPWLTVLDARLEDSRLSLGGLRLEGVNARLATGGATEALVFDGDFAWRGQPVRFTAQLGRAGLDGIAPLDLSLAAAGASLSTRGALLPGGGFEGRMDAAGRDLSALIPSPAGPFRATGQLTAMADLIAAGDLTLDLGGQPARGAISLRLVPEPQLDVTLAAARADLDAWIGALGAARALPLPVSLDLSAEVSAYAGIPLRRLRGAAVLGPTRIALTDVSAHLPGDTLVELSGASAGGRMELQLHVASAALREALVAVGMPPGLVDPARLRAADGRFRLVLEGGQTSLSELTAQIDGARVTGAMVWRPAGEGRPRRSLGIGLGFDRLDLNGLLPGLLEQQAALGGRFGALDLNLRLAADRLVVGEWQAERAALDATLEAGRLALRRVALRVAGLDVVAAGGLAPSGPAAPAAAAGPAPPGAGVGSGGGAGAGAIVAAGAAPLGAVPGAAASGPAAAGPAPGVAAAPSAPAASGILALGAGLRLNEGTLEVSGPNGGQTLALLAAGWSAMGPALGPAAWPAPQPALAVLREALAGQSVALRVTGAGTAEALQLRAEAELGELRLEAAGSFDLPAARAAGRLTLRHPGAPRLLAPLLGAQAGDWLGAGSLSAIAQLSGQWGGAPGLAIEGLELVAGGLRGTGQLALSAGPTPRLTGRLAAERLPLPALALGSARPFALAWLGQAELALELAAARLEPLGGPVVLDAVAQLRLAGGRLALDGLRGRLAGGALEATLAVEAAGEARPPQLTLAARLRDAVLTEPLSGLALDLGAGRVSLETQVVATGHSPAALAATVSGTLTLQARDGVLLGYDLPAVSAAARQAVFSEPALRQALAGGGAARFATLGVAARLEEGRLVLDSAELAAESGLAATASGVADLARGTLDLRLGTRPDPAAPELVLRLLGPLAAPARLPELGPYLRWRAEQ